LPILSGKYRTDRTCRIQYHIVNCLTIQSTPGISVRHPAKLATKHSDRV